MSGRGRGSSGRGGGRGEYYKNKYGGGRGGGRGGRGGGRGSSETRQRSGGDSGGTYHELVSLLRSIDNKSYPAYHDIESSTNGWVCSTPLPFTLYIGRAQSDPFAPPTRCRIVVPATTAKFPPELHKNKTRAIALGDYINRVFHATCVGMGADQGAGGQGWSGPKGGDIQIQAPSQHVIEQSAVTVSHSTGDITAQFTVNLPARGRTILGWRAVEIIENVLPLFVQKSLVYAALDASKLHHHVKCVEDQRWLRGQLSSNNLIAFIPNGAILPRMSGVDDRPMMEGDGNNNCVVRFDSPESLCIEFHLPSTQQKIKGMGVKKGITLVVGGGFHGKSTLLSALQVGVYDKIPGDGREYCVCDETAIKIRAEDGRAVTSVNITPFITNLPFGKLTNNFTTLDASGSTSQASNIMEALEIGCKTLLVDEDTCATNFMIRDEKMIQLVAPNKEPITPFVRKVRSLYEDKGVSSILVIGGSGDYFEVADTVVMMDCYKCVDVTDRAKQISLAGQSSSHTSTEVDSHIFGTITNRYPHGNAFIPNNKVKVKSRSAIAYGDVEVDLSGLEQIVCQAQTQSLSHILRMIPTLAASNDKSISDILSEFEEMFNKEGGGLDELNPPGTFHGGLCRPRRVEIAGAINRLRADTNSIHQKDAGNQQNKRADL